MADADSWRHRSAAEIGRAIGDGSLDPVALTEAYLAAAGGAAGAQVYAALMPERALAQALAARARAAAGTRRSALDGVPVSWKDLFDIAGAPCEGGTALLAGRVPTRTAALVHLGEAAGLVSLGKTHLSELAFSGLGYNPVTATPANALMPGHLPGGSSSGAAASVAFGMAAVAVGTDTGGSVRVPAAWNGLVGLKTTHGALSMAGAIGLAPGYDTAGPLTRTVEDAALMLAALTGGPVADRAGINLAARRFSVETSALDDLAPEVAAAFETACARLSTAGAVLSHQKLPEVAELLSLSGPLYTGEAWAQWGEAIAARGQVMFDRVRERFEAGQTVSAADYLRARAARDRLRAAIWPHYAGVDAVLLPTCPGLPPTIAGVTEDPAVYVAENLRALRNTRIGNLLDAAVLTLPLEAAGCGLSLLGPPGSERRLLRLGAAVEEALAA